VNQDDDKRPDPKPRKHAHLWQAYLIWREFEQLRVRHKLRQSSISRGKSHLDATVEQLVLEQLAITDIWRKEMRNYGRAVGPIWDWLIGIRGIADHTAAKLLALYDDVSKFATVSKFWRFAGQAVIDGKAERRQPGEKAHFCAQLKAECYLIRDQFVRQQTPGYVTIYYDEKARQAALYPDPICSCCGSIAVKRGAITWRCPDRCGKRIDFTPLHLDYRAKRKMVKQFLCDFWTQWRLTEGLTVSLPYDHRRGSSHK